MASIVIAAVSAPVMKISMLASLRSRCSSARRSGVRLGGTSPVTRTEIGASKRVRRATGRPLSMRKARSIKSLPISRLDRTGVATDVPAKERMGGNASLSPKVRVGRPGATEATVCCDCGTGVQAVIKVMERAKRRRNVRLMTPPAQVNLRFRPNGREGSNCGIPNAQRDPRILDKMCLFRSALSWPRRCAPVACRARRPAFLPWSTLLSFSLSRKPAKRLRPKWARNWAIPR